METYRCRSWNSGINLLFSCSDSSAIFLALAASRLLCPLDFLDACGKTGSVDF